MISDERMDELIQRAKNAATRWVGGGDGSPSRELFSEDVYKTTFATLVELETKKIDAGEEIRSEASAYI